MLKKPLNGYLKIDTMKKPKEKTYTVTTVTGKKISVKVK